MKVLERGIEIVLRCEIAVGARHKDRKTDRAEDKRSDARLSLRAPVGEQAAEKEAGTGKKQCKRDEDTLLPRGKPDQRERRNGEEQRKAIAGLEESLEPKKKQ